MAQTMEICGREYPITGYVKSKKFGVKPMVNIPMMSDYDWQVLALNSRLDHPEKYRARGEDVEAAIAKLRRWLEENSRFSESRREEIPA